MTSTDERPTAWWLETLKRRRATRGPDPAGLSTPVEFESDDERRAAIKFFNAALRAEESGITQAHALAEAARATDPELAETLRLYGDEEGWHRELLTSFLAHLGGGVMPMGRVTTLLYSLYARAERPPTILLTNLMFETIGSTTYRLALGKVPHAAAREMLRILTRDEAFHVPLNAHFLRLSLAGAGALERAWLVCVFHAVFAALVALPLASRPKARAFDRIPTLELSRAYARELHRVFAREPTLPFVPPAWLLHLLRVETERATGSVAVTSPEAADRAADREAVHVTAL